MKDIHLVTTPDKDWKLSALPPVPTSVNADDTEDAKFSVTVPDDATITKPYFTRPNLEQPYYDISNPEYLNRSWMPYPLAARARFTYRRRGRSSGPGGADRAFGPWLRAGHGSHARGSGNFGMGLAEGGHRSAHQQIVQDPCRKFVATYKVPRPAAFLLIYPMAGHPILRRRICHPARWREQNIEFEVVPGRVEAKPYRITAAAVIPGHTYSSGSTSVGYPGLRSYPYYRDATYRTTGVDIQIRSGLTVGYVTGTGDNLAASLRK